MSILEAQGGDGCVLFVSVSVQIARIAPERGVPALQAQNSAVLHKERSSSASSPACAVNQ